MTRDNEYYAYFTLVGDFEPGDVSARLKLCPTECWKKGDLNERTHLERKFSRWSLHSRLGREMPLEQHLDDVLEQLKPATAAVAAIRSELEGGINMVGFFHREYPGMSFTDVTFSRLASLKLGMDFDFYYMYSDRREDS